MSYATRQELLGKIETKRQSKVIVYFTSDRRGLQSAITADAIPVLHKHLRSVCPASADPPKLDLFLYSRGGDANVPWTMVSMFREYSRSGTFGILVPFRAHSAATVVCLGADEVVMTRKAELGPIDATIEGGPYNPREEKTGRVLPVSVEDVTGYFHLLEMLGCDGRANRMQALKSLSERTHPLVIGSVKRLLDQTRQVAIKLLRTRHRPFTAFRNNHIVQQLSSEISSHSHAIHFTEAARDLKLRHVMRAEDEGIEEDLWSLYEDYAQFFRLESPFDPETSLLSTGGQERTWRELPLACVESGSRFDLLVKDVRCRPIKSVPPQVTLNVSNIVVPPPAAVSGLTAEQMNANLRTHLQQILPPVLNEAVAAAIRDLLRALPHGGFERIDYNQKWVDGSAKESWHED